MEALCTICVREGSKGIPGKNLRELHGKPLMAYSIEQALASELFSHVIVSTDSPRIANEAQRLGAESWFLRPKELATDYAPKLPTIRHAFVEAEKYYGRHFDVLVDLDATSPLRRVMDIERAYQQLLDEDSNNLISVNHAAKNPYFNMVEVSGGSPKLIKHTGKSNLTTKPDCRILDALEMLNTGGEKCVVVVDQEGNLLGTLSDGDLRKALVNGIQLNMSIREIYNPRPCTLTAGKYSLNDAKNLFTENKYDLIPIVNESGKFVDYLVWEELFLDETSISRRGIGVSIPARRQDAPEVYDVNASIYIWRRRSILEDAELLTANTSLYLMPRRYSIDIDSEIDWEFVEFLMTKRKEEFPEVE